jgi:hypothetical protein
MKSTTLGPMDAATPKSLHKTDVVLVKIKAMKEVHVFLFKTNYFI